MLPKIVHKTAETISQLIKNNIAERIVKPKPLSDVNSKKKIKKKYSPREKIRNVKQIKTCIIELNTI